MTMPMGLAVSATFKSHWAAVQAPVATVTATDATAEATVATVWAMSCAVETTKAAPAVTTLTVRLAIPEAAELTRPPSFIIGVAKALCAARALVRPVAKFWMPPAALTKIPAVPWEMANGLEPGRGDSRRRPGRPRAPGSHPVGGPGSRWKPRSLW